MTDNKTVLQALAVINDCNKYKIDLTTNGLLITEAIKFVQSNKEKLTMSTKEEDNGKESREPDYDEDKDQLEENQESLKRKQRIRFFEFVSRLSTEHITIFNSLP
jgi:hypothetical protein